jgi:hypothetical protein
LKNSDLLKKRPIEEKKNPYYDGKYMKWKRCLQPPKSNESETEPNHLIKKYSQEFVKRHIDAGEFKDILDKNGINSNSEAINKLIRQNEGGENVKLSELLFNIINYGKDKFDPTTVKFDKGSNAFKEAKEGQNLDKSMLPISQGSAQL